MKFFKFCEDFKHNKDVTKCKLIIQTSLFIISLIFLFLLNLFINNIDYSERYEKSEQPTFLHRITDLNFDSLLSISNEKLVILNFSLPNIVPCENLDTNYNKLAKSFKDSILFCNINTDSLKNITKKYKITSIPTLKFILNNKEEMSTVGYLKISEITYIIDKIISENNLNQVKDNSKKP